MPSLPVFKEVKDVIVKVLIDTQIKKLNRVFDYIVPKELEKDIEIGKRVSVNFGQGKGRSVEGIIVKTYSEKDTVSNVDISKFKAIENILDTESYLNENRLKIAKWISRMYFCNVYAAIKLMLPPSTSQKLELKNIKGKQATVITLNKTEFEINNDIELGVIKSPRHIRLLRFLNENQVTFLEDALNGLGISKNIISTVEKNGYIKLEKIDVENEDYKDIGKSSKLEPTNEQRTVIDSLKSKIQSNKFNVSLLHGVTGSGKTEVYLQIIEECINQGKSSIILVPEISLTDQTKRRFISRFGKIVSVIHSKMTILERQTEYKRIVKGEAKIVIGPRSALFVPMKNIGLIVIDEEHDSSYISQSTPKYNTKEVATRIAHMHDALLLLGSATPEIGTMYKAKSSKIDYYQLTSRPGTFNMPQIKVVDMKEEVLTSGYRLISSSLREEISHNIESNQQTFIFLNRRGYSSYVMCNDCGKILKCKNCDVNLTYHKKTDLLLCHYCSYCEKVKKVCPSCGSNKITQGGVGTEKIEKELIDLFPNIKILRMDTDTTVKRGSHEKILNTFKEEQVDILVGTQMISKGHDIENVTLVGIINADSNFASNDFSVAERAFSNLLQVSGRSGRGTKKGRVIVQVYDTEHYIIEALKEQSYDDFYNKEITFRQMANYPPFTDIILIEIVSKSKESIMKDGKKLHNLLSSGKREQYNVYLPQIPYISKINNKYRLQIVIKAKISDKILDLLYEKLDKYDKIKDRNVTISVTKNPGHIS